MQRIQENSPDDNSATQNPPKEQHFPNSGKTASNETGYLTEASDGAYEQISERKWDQGYPAENFLPTSQVENVKTVSTKICCSHKPVEMVTRGTQCYSVKSRRLKHQIKEAKKITPDIERKSSQPIYYITK